MARSENTTDHRIHKALSHPIRVEILKALDEGAASAVEVSRSTGLPVTRVSYHFNQLAQLGLIELASITPRRGVVERHYTLKEPVSAAASEWRNMSTSARQAGADEVLGDVADEVSVALSAGTFTAADVHVAQIELELDGRGVRDAAKELAALAGRLRAIERESARRLKTDGTDRSVRRVVMLQFPTAPK